MATSILSPNGAIKPGKCTPLWLAGPAARLLSRPCGNWRVPHGIGVLGQVAFVPYRVLARVSVMEGYAARAIAEREVGHG